MLVSVRLCVLLRVLERERERQIQTDRQCVSSAVRLMQGNSSNKRPHMPPVFPALQIVTAARKETDGQEARPVSLTCRLELQRPDNILGRRGCGAIEVPGSELRERGCPGHCRDGPSALRILLQGSPRRRGCRRPQVDVVGVGGGGAGAVRGRVDEVVEEPGRLGAAGRVGGFRPLQHRRARGDREAFSSAVARVCPPHERCGVRSQARCRGVPARSLRSKAETNRRLRSKAAIQDQDLYGGRWQLYSSDWPRLTSMRVMASSHRCIDRLLLLLLKPPVGGPPRGFPSGAP